MAKALDIASTYRQKTLQWASKSAQLMHLATEASNCNYFHWAIPLWCKKEMRVLVRGGAHGQSTWYWFHLQAKNHCNGPPKVHNWCNAPQKPPITTIFTEPLPYDVNNKYKVLEQGKRDKNWPNSAPESPWSLTVFFSVVFWIKRTEQFSTLQNWHPSWAGA